MKIGYVSLERALSKLGIASRTVARDWILTGRVRVNGIVRTKPLFPISPERAKIEIDGKLVGPIELKYILLHKPRGVITTRVDEKGRPTVFSLIKNNDTHLGAVGRLDFATSGLLILTNDTRLSAWLCDPSNEIPRVYAVSVRGEITEQNLLRLRDGIIDQNETLRPDQITLRKASKKESHLIVELKEGKNREIRRMFAAIGNEVIRLKRISFGGLCLGELQPSEYRDLSAEELQIAFPTVPHFK